MENFKQCKKCGSITAKYNRICYCCDSSEFVEIPRKILNIAINQDVLEVQEAVSLQLA
jgi:RNA polymerase subunit RPABC4/transcription elongation factor Spt4